MLERYVQRNSAWLFPFSVFLFAVMGALKKNGRSEKKPLAGFFYFTFFHAEAGTLSHNVLCVISAPRWSEALIIASSSLPDSLSRKR